MSASFDDVGTNELHSPDLFQDYDLNTPGKFLTGIALVLHKSAIISFDYEFTDYSWAKYENSYYFSGYNANKRIDEIYTYANNFKLGAEYRYSFFSFRAGAAYYGSPYKNTYSNSNSYTMLYSTGIGFNAGIAYLDLTYLYQENKGDFYLYSLNNQVVDPVEYKKQSNKFMMTFGFRF
jgi:hypothetical protein